MLTSDLVRVRHARHQVIPSYLDVADPAWREAAEQLIYLFRSHLQRTRGELEAEIDELFGDAPTQQVHRGLAKLLQDRCEFAMADGLAPEQVRAVVFRAAAAHRQGRTAQPAVAVGDAPLHWPGFDRAAVLAQAARELGVETAEVERGLFADLKAVQQLVSFKDLSAERLLQRYNVALAQAVLLRAVSVEVLVRHESPQRYRHLLRLMKFHRLLYELELVADGVYRLRLDGPLSLFVSTQKYGLQLALFLPAVLLCRDFELQAELRWGTQRTPRRFRLTSEQGLVSHLADPASYVPPELAMFAESFRKKITDWDLVEQTELLRLGDTLWAPDFQLVHKESGQVVYLDVLGYWRRASARQHLERLRADTGVHCVVAVSEQLDVSADDGQEPPAGLYRFRQMPLPEEVARRAAEFLMGSAKKHPEACKSQGG